MEGEFKILVAKQMWKIVSQLSPNHNRLFSSHNQTKESHFLIHSKFDNESNKQFAKIPKVFFQVKPHFANFQTADEYGWIELCLNYWHPTIRILFCYGVRSNLEQWLIKAFWNEGQKKKKNLQHPFHRVFLSCSKKSSQC